MNIKNVILAFILGILAFIAGASWGMLFQNQKSVALPQVQNQAMSETVKALSSNVVPSIAAYGIITNISGRNITLTAQHDSMTVPINQDAQIYSFVPDASAAPSAKNTSSSRQIALSDIKKGDNASINIKVLGNGQLSGTSVIILPPALSPATK
jgi:hypothetical protein